MKKFLLVLAVVGWGALAWAQEASAADKSVTLVFAGDTVLDDAPGALIARSGDPFADFVAVLEGADIRIANLECVVATMGSAGDKNFTFRAHPRVLPVVKKHFDAVALANNHSGDFGREAFAEMLGLLKQADLGQFGGGHHFFVGGFQPAIADRKSVV